MKDEILVVDDESGIIESLQKLLQEHAYIVHTATSGEAALSFLSNKSVHIVISDIRMPGMDGIELVRKAQKIVPDVQCIFITGYDGRKIAVEATKLGGFSYLKKPLSIDELIVAIWKAQEKLDLLRTIQKMKEKKQDKKQLILKQIPNAIFDIMNISVRYWELSCGKTKVELAEDSRIWTVMLDKDNGCYRTRTMDRYLKISTIPKNPNYNKVLNTGSFVLKKCPHDYPDLEKQLKTKMQQLIDLRREKETIRG